MTPIPFTLSTEDVLSAGRFGFIRAYRQNILRNSLILVFIAGLISAGIEIFDGFEISSFLELFMILVLIYTGLLLVLIPVAWFVLVPIKTKKTFQQMPAISREQTLSWDDRAIMISSSQGNMCVPYAEFHRWTANKNVIMVYPADYVFYVLPRRIFPSQEGFDELAGLLLSSGVTKL